MGPIRRPRYADVSWGLLALAVIMTAFGLSAVVSATWDPSGGWGRLGRQQLAWWLLGLLACAICMHVPLSLWRRLALPAFAGMLLVKLFMVLAAGTPVVPLINGEHNWIVLGPLRIQPSEFYKLAVLLTIASLLSDRRLDVRRFDHCLLILAIGVIPMLMLAAEDFGSSLTFGPMIVGSLIFAGMSLRHLLALSSAAAAGGLAMVASLPRSGYQWRRIQAWLDPESFALSEGYQTIRALRSVGSGQWTGKGYGLGDQNVLGWLPENHTDMIFAVIAEELGFLGAVLVPLLFLAFGLTGMAAAARCRDPFGAGVLAGFICLIMGQTTINLLVVLGLMPVTGVPLPFFSYGGSSLLATWSALGICLSASAAKQQQLGLSRYKL